MPEEESGTSVGNGKVSRAATSPVSVGSGVKSLERALDIMEVLGRSEREVGISEIGTEAGLANGTVHRLLSTLTRRGYVRQNPGTRKYALGVKSLTLASSARDRLGPLSKPFLRELMEVSQESSNLAGLEKDSIVYLEQVPAPRMVRMFTEPGNRVAPHATGSGKVILAYQPDEVVDATIRRLGMPRFTPYTITDPKRFKRELSAIRSRGYAMDSEEMEEGVRCLAAPVQSPDGRTLAAMSLSGPVGRLGESRIEELVPHIKRIAASFSDSLASAT